VNALTEIIAATRADVARRRAARPLSAVQADASGRLSDDPPRSLAAALSRPGLSVIAEHKRRSPSAGVIREDLSLHDVIGAYERAGASALSVLTDARSFGGSLADLEQARAISNLPILRKDFIVDPYQVPEALASGADAILLIVAALDDGELEALYGQALGLGLEVLVEIHDEAELARALALRAAVIGINNRDLTTLEVDTNRCRRLVPLIGSDTVVVAESGYRSRTDVEALSDLGVDAVLVGEALMRSPNIEAACRVLTGATIS